MGNGLGCTRHPKPVLMKLVQTTEKDGTPKEWFACPKCHQILPATEELKGSLQRLIDTLAEEQKALEAEAQPLTAVTTELEVKKESI